MKKSRRKYPTNENSFGGRLRIFRESAGLKLVDFSLILGISHGSLSEIENNRTNMSSKPLKKLILNTDINIYWLYTGQGNMTRSIDHANAHVEDKGGDTADMNDEFLKKMDAKFSEVLKDIKLFVYEKLDKVDDDIKRLRKEFEHQRELNQTKDNGTIIQPKIGRGQPSDQLIKEVDVSSI